MMNKCIFLDRDGVINEERGDYTYHLQDFKIIDGVSEALKSLKEEGFLLIIVTNQAGISKGRYTEKEMRACHTYLLQETNHIIDAIYHCPYHPEKTNSLSRKPDSLMFEKALARFKIKTGASWMIGDKERDLIPAKKLGLRTILIGNNECLYADYTAKDLKDATTIVINNQH